MITRLASVIAASTVIATAAIANPLAASAADRGVRSATDAIAGQYVVVLADQDLSPRESRSREIDLARHYGARIGHAYQSAVKGFSASLTPGQAQQLAQDPAVAYVEQDARISASATTQSNPPSWGLDRVDQRARTLDRNYAYANAGSGVTAYVIDSGIRTTHVQFGGRATVGAD